MSQRFSRSTAALALLAALALSACGGDEDPGNVEPSNSAAAEPTYELRLATPLTENALHSQLIKAWGERITELTDGQVAIETFYSGSLLPTLEIAPGVGSGLAEIGLFGETYHPAELPLWAFGQRPFVTRNWAAQSQTVGELGRTNAELLREYESMGIYPLISVSAGSNALITKEPTTGVDDLDGLSLRAGGITAVVMTSAGADVKTIDFSEVFDALQRGVVEAVSGISALFANDAGIFEQAKYYADPGMGEYSFNLLAINKELWDEFPDDVRAAFEQATDEFYENLEADFTAYDVQLCDEMKEQGVSVSAWEEDEQRRLSDLVKDDMQASYLNAAKEAGLEAEADELLVQYDELLADYEEASDYVPFSETCVTD